MKKFSLRHVLILCLPIVIIAAVAAIIVESHRKERLYYSQPFAPRLEVVRAGVPKFAPNDFESVFEVEAKCIANGGNGQSSWLVRAQLFDVGGEKPREIWNSQKLVVPKLVGLFMSGHGGSHFGGAKNQVSNTWGTAWRFRRYYHRADHLKMVVEAVALPFPPEQQDEMGTQSIIVTEATPAQIAVARRQPNARYFRESLILDAKDDKKHLYP